MKNLSRKFFWIETRKLFLAVLLPVFILGLIAGILYIQVLCQEINSNLDVKAMHFSNHLSNVTQTIEDLYNSLSQNPLITPSLRDTIIHISNGQLSQKNQEQFKMLLDLIFDACQKNPYVESCYIYYDDTDYYISSSKHLTLLRESADIGWHETYLQTDKNLENWSENRTLIREDGSTEEVLTIYNRIFNDKTTGQSCGVFVFNVNCTRLKNILEKWYSQSKTIALITAESGRILFDPPSAKSVLPVPLPSLGSTLRSLFDQTWRQDDLARQNIRLGTDSYVCLINRLSRFGWHLALLTARRDLYAPVDNILFILISMILLTLLCGLIFAAHTARQKVRDIARVHDSIQRAKDGHSASLAAGNTDSIYSQVLRELIDTFLDKDYLSVQLAERQHYAEVLELKALQSQLNPHFLFNTLTTIQWKAIALTGGQNDASNMIEYLSDILRYSLDDSNRMATVREELAILESYAAIQQIRYGERLNYSCTCAPDTLGQYIIRMLLQPLVENSIHHGMSNDRNCLNVCVQITSEQDHLLIRVSDDGPGIDETRLREVRAGLAESSQINGRHIGLSNVSKRIKLIYGEEVHLNIDSTPGQGTVITLRLPQMDADPFGRTSEQEST